MTAPALLLLAACALAAPLHAATLPAEGRHPPALPEPADIPVQVLLENAEPSVKLNEVDDDEALRPPLDLRNPGPPQRQEHETQNPEQHPDDQLRVSSIKESIERTKNLLRESIEGVSENIQTWFYKNDDQNKIQNNIQALRDTFSNQIQKLDEAIKALAKPGSESAELPAQKSLRNYGAIETELKTLKDNFNNDMETLSAGVELVSSLRSNVGEGDAKEDEVPAEANPEPAPPAPAPPAPEPPAPASPAPVKPGDAATPAPAGFIAQTMNNIFNGISTSFQNLQNLLTPPASSQPPAQSPPPAEAQADAPAAPTARPPWSLPTFNFTNPLSQLQGSFANFTQNFQPPNGWFNGSFPTLQPIQDFLPSFQNVLPPILRPSTTVKPAEAGNSAAAAEPAAAQPAADKPAAAPAPVAVTDGPIRQFLNSIPVVQRLQSSFANRDTPRQPAAAAAPAAPAAPAAAAAPVTAEKSDAQSKGGWYGPGRPGGGSGDNNDSGVSQTKSVEPKEILKDEIKEEAPVKEDSIKEEAVKPEIIKEEPVKEETLKTEIIKEEPIKEEVLKTDIIKEEPSKEEQKKEKEAEAKPESIPDKTE